ncbi:hypothetical protein BN946_scf184687.g9 [Trametes cinnabarina]|uniref:Cytochrome b5 heme-binding domain-containing protein n=1 Tax=Pycnoporus cinnabarinus TaxID=5643 RepID=A0A060SBQ9_PYCCI|nr:hypothetical protein BN946_scf184687.g9 [Trametes cinnabarina]
MPPPTTTKPPAKPSKRGKVALAPGHGPLDWANLKKSGQDLRGTDTLLRVTPSMLKEHRSKDDAWTAISGKVYNITHYLPYHPGGEKELMRVAGRDGTKLFGPFSSPGKHGGSPQQNRSAHDNGKKPLHQNRSWVRGRDPEPLEVSPTGSETGRPSLLDRIESPSLLKRIAPTKEKSAPTSLVDRIRDTPGLEPPAEIEIEQGEILQDEDVEMREEGQTTPPKRIHVKAEETISVIPSPTKKPVGRARGVRSTIDVFGEPTQPVIVRAARSAPDVTIKKEKSPPFDSTPVSETTVEALLATILPADGQPNDGVTTVYSSPQHMSTPRSQSAPGASRDEDIEIASHTSMSTEPATSPQPSEPLPSHLLEKCRSLLLPSIVQLAIRRNPGLDPKIAEKRAMARLSGDKCSELIKLARRMREQIQEQEKATFMRAPETPRRASRGEAKRSREDDWGPDEPATKLLRIHSPDDKRDGGRATEPLDAASPLPSTWRTDDHDRDSGVLTRETTHPLETAASQHASRITTAKLASPGQSETPMLTSDLLSGSISNLSLQSSLVASNHESLSGQMHAPLPAEWGSSSASSVERALSAGTDHPSVAFSHPISATALTPRLSLSRARSPAEHADTLPSISADLSHLNNVTRTLHASPSNTANKEVPEAQHTIEDEIRVKEDPKGMPQQQYPPALVPALWAAIGGKPSSDVEEVHFFVDDATADAARHWARRKETFSFEHRHVKVHLLCLPAAAVAVVHQNLPPDASREDIVDAMWNIKTEWPSRGTLLIDIASDDFLGPCMPEPDSGPLDITQAIHRGANKLRLIQLADMSSKLFVVHATEPSGEERRKVGTETIALMRMFAKLAPQSFGTDTGPATYTTRIAA